MSKEPKKELQIATVLWFGMTAAVLGFATVYITLKLAGNLIYPETAKPVQVKTTPASKVQTARQGQTPQNTAPAKLNTNPPEKIGEQASNVRTYQNLTEISKNKKLPVNIAGKNADKNSLVGANKGELAGFLVRAQPQDIPVFDFITSQGVQKSLADWKGKIVLLNIWATWCVPCRTEMPDLDLLKGKLGGKDFDVVTVSIDRGGLVKPAKFFQKLNIKNLVLYSSATPRLSTKLRAPGLPATILVGRNGKELGRLIGPAKWASNDAVNLIKAAIALP